MLLTILFVIALAAGVFVIVAGVQKAKAEKKGIYAEKCPYHNISDEEIVGYETAAPAPAPTVVEAKPKKKAAKKAPVKKTASKKANSSQKKK